LAEGFDGLFDRSLYSFAAGSVCLDRDSLSATVNRFNHVGSRARLRVCDGHVWLRPRPDVLATAGANAARAARNEGNLSFQLLRHRFFLPFLQSRSLSIQSRM